MVFTEARGRYFSRGGRRFLEELGGNERPFVPSSAGFGEALDRILDCAPTLSALREDLFVSEIIPLANGEIVSFFMDKRFQGGTEFLSSFIYRDNGPCLWNQDRPASYDPDRGYVVRKFWDLFDFEGRPHVLVVRYDYELLAMEVFRVDSDRLVSVSEFGFSCLGCDE